jgi:hypothetical protein
MDEIKMELRNIKETQDRLVECQIEMQADIKHHIKRTDSLQNMVEPTYKAYIGMKWAAASVITLGAVVTALAKISGLF